MLTLLSQSPAPLGGKKAFLWIPRRMAGQAEQYKLQLEYGRYMDYGIFDCTKFILMWIGIQQLIGEKNIHSL